MRRVYKFALCASLLVLGGCTSGPPVDLDRHTPRFIAEPEVLATATASELEQSQLVATNLVSALVQLPELQPVARTLQVSPPTTVFGHTLIKTLEQAGYGLQQVDADQGVYYVSYGRRFAETDAGPVTDFEVRIGPIRVRREFQVADGRVFPSSLMQVEGSLAASDVQLSDELFREQGGTRQFVSGVSARDGEQTARSEVDELAVRAFDETPQERRTPTAVALEQARTHYYKSVQMSQKPDLDQYDRVRRTVLVFDDDATQIMGPGNKAAVRLMVRDQIDTDRFVITACNDADGRNESAEARGVRVEEEFVSNGVDDNRLYRAPCVRASFRPPSDKSPVAVEVVQFRQKGALP